MEKKVDLNESKPKENNYQRVRVTHTEQRSNNTEQEKIKEEEKKEESGIKQYGEAYAKEIAKDYLRTKIGSLADSELADKIIEKGIKQAELKMKIRRVYFISLFLILILALAFAAVYVTTLIEGNNKGSGGIATSGYYNMKCDEVTVIFTDKSNGYEVTGSNNYSLDDYVAGVINAEVGMFNNLEVYKEFALAARTYFALNEQDCTIESSDRKQVFNEIPGGKSNPSASLIYQAVEDTKGQVILQDNELYYVEYDAFCSIDIDDNYYTIKQANQKIPKSWVDSQSGIASEWKQGNCEGNHGRGLSQWGSFYLATEQGYKYNEILEFYLGDTLSISSGGFMSSIPGLEIKNTTGATELHEDLATFLSKNGSSVEEMNSFITDKVRENGAGTREGVVTAAVSIVNYLYDGMGVKIPYYWNGKYNKKGVNPQFGGYTNPSDHGEVYAGFDCSGFVSWAITNGGYKFHSQSTRGFDENYSEDSCLMSNSSCKGQPGDLINGSSCHVQLIVSVDEDNQIYYVAESGPGLVMNSVSMHSGSCGSNTKILHMDNFYNNSANRDPNY